MSGTLQIKQSEEAKAQISRLEAALELEKQENVRHIARQAADELVVSTLKGRVKELEGHHDHLRETLQNIVGQLQKGNSLTT